MRPSSANASRRRCASHSGPTCYPPDVSNILTLIAAPGTELQSRDIARARAVVDGAEPEILSPGEAVDIPCAAPPPLPLVRAALAGSRIDAIAVKRRGRRKAVLVADMDSTIVVNETLDDLARRAGAGELVAGITRRSMNGEIDFAAALVERVATLRGVPLTALHDTWAETVLTPGARALVATMRRHGALCALVSGGFTFFTGRVATLCGFDAHRANVLLDDGEALTGAVRRPILDRDAKRWALAEFATERRARLSATLAVGDGANDLAMLQAAGLGIAFRPKPILADAIANRLDHADLRALLFAQGYKASDITEELPVCAPATA